MDGTNRQDRPNNDGGQCEQEINPPNANSSAIKTWTPARFLSSKARDAEPDNPYAVIILNQPIDNKDLLVEVCRGATYKACADGGANRLKDADLQGSAETLCRPDLICGDLDSIRPSVRTHYQTLGTHIHHDADQNSTDLTKTLKHLRTLPQPPRALDVLLLCPLSGRADHALSLLHHLYAATQNPALAAGDVYLLTGASVLFVLHRGRNAIRTPVGPGLLAESVGIVPLGRPAVLSTRGLEWDVSDWATEMGGRVSTSNRVREGVPVVEVETSERVVFTVEVAGRGGE